MNSNRRNIYDLIIENPLFFKWIFYSSPEIDAYWNHYLKSHTEGDQIKELKSEIELHLKYDDKKLSDREKKALAAHIARKLDQSDVKRTRSRIIRSIIQYAAVAFIFLFIGGSLVYLYMERRQPQIIFGNAALPALVQEPVLIMGDRSQVSLNQGESQLEYTGNGKIILNHDQTIRDDNRNSAPEMNTLVIPYGSRSTITLADGTKVWLNSGSRLIYPSWFSDKNREVFLIGEAFFDITKNEKQPFVVKTPDLQLEVLGTKFNMAAYPEDFAVQTVLVEGSVEIKQAGIGRRDKGIVLEPGYMAYYNRKNQQVRTQKVNVEEYILWIQGLFSFTNTDFNRITKKLERYYNVHFEYDDPFKAGIQVSGKLDVTKERAEVFKYLERLTGLQIIEINERNYVIK